MQEKKKIKVPNIQRVMRNRLHLKEKDNDHELGITVQAVSKIHMRLTKKGESGKVLNNAWMIYPTVQDLKQLRRVTAYGSHCGRRKIWVPGSRIS